MTAPHRTDVDFDQLDADIQAAWLDVQAARRTWARCPSSENDAAHDQAEANLNDLLEFRHLVRPPQP